MELTYFSAHLLAIKRPESNGGKQGKPSLPRWDGGGWGEVTY